MRRKILRLLGSTLFLIGVFSFSACATQHPDPRVPKADLEHNDLKRRELRASAPHYRLSALSRYIKILSLNRKVKAREEAGKNIEYQHQVMSELLWLISSTSDFKRMDERIAELKKSLADPAFEDWKDTQSPVDGSWGGGYSEWFFKLVASFPHLKGEMKSSPLLLDRINSPEKLTAYLTSVSVSDIPKTGVDNYREFNESLSCIQRLILRGQPKNYAWDPQIKPALMDLILHRFRNPETGFWGPSYIRDGKAQFVDDLSMTFHTISYLAGNVPGMDKVVDTTLAVKNLDYPVGWLWEGHYWNHNNMDVVDLFKWGWPYATDAQKKEIAVEIRKMLDWCLRKSLQKNGSFAFNIADGSVEEGVYYGTSFLGRIGFFDKSRRFWTDEELSDATEVRERIHRFIQKHRDSGATGGDYYEGALEELGYPEEAKILKE